MKTLIVEDEFTNRIILQQTLEVYGVVHVAVNGVEAVEAVRAALDAHAPYDLICLDIMMPEMDGYEVCRRLKENKQTSRIPVIFVTTLDNIEDESKGFQLGCVDYITKPVSHPIALARIKTHLDLKHTKAKVDQLLSKTLLGSFKMMSDIMSMVNPVALSQSSRLKRCAGEIGKKLGLEGLWLLEIAAALSQIGTIAIPKESLIKARLGKMLDFDEQKLMNAYPAIGKELLINLPSLEKVAEIIGSHRDPLPDTALETWDFITISSQILKNGL